MQMRAYPGSLQDLSSSKELSPLNDPDQHNDDGNNEQDMDKVTHRIAGHQTQQPEDYQDYRDCPQPGGSPFNLGSGSLTVGSHPRIGRQRADDFLTL